MASPTTEGMMAIKGVDDLSFALEMMEHIARMTGMVSDTAIDDYVKLHVQEYEIIKNPLDGARQLVHAASGQDAHVWTNTEGRTKWSHYWPRAHDPDMAERAFGDAPSLTAQMELSRTVGTDEAARIATQWGSKLGNLRAGKRPDEPAIAASDRAAKIEKLERELAQLKAAAPKAPPGAENPWLAKNWNVTRQASIVKAMGLERANQIASRAGCRVGDTKPNALYNR
jgi:hypothetical protein